MFDKKFDKKRKENENKDMIIDVLKPEGYCKGVSRAIEIAKNAKKENPDKEVFVLGLLVHNEYVIENLLNDGIKTLKVKTNLKELIDEVPFNSVVIFTAHGHDPKLKKYALDKGLIVYDATCPKVESNIKLIQSEINNGHEVIYIGDQNHPEAIAALSLSKSVYLKNKQILNIYQNITDASPLVVNQTTYNINDLKEIYEDIELHFPNARFANEICNTTRNRQENILNLDFDVDYLIVLGSKSSSNTKRLLEIAKSSHPELESVLIDSVNELNIKKASLKKHIAIASGASTPFELIKELENKLRSL